LPDWQPHYYGERGYAGGACDGGGLGHGGGVVSGASLCADREACVYWRRDDDYAGCAAVFEDVGGARDAGLWIECGGAGAAWVLERTDSEAASCLPGAAGGSCAGVRGGGRGDSGRGGG